MAYNITLLLRYFEENTKKDSEHRTSKTILKDVKKILDIENTIYESWNIKDIRSCAKDNKKGEVSKKDAREILRTVEHNFNANEGINWNSILDAIEYNL